MTFKHYSLGTGSIEDATPREFTLCNQLVTLAAPNVLSIQGQEYTANGENNANGDCDYSGHSCTGVRFGARFYWADVPVCG